MLHVFPDWFYTIIQSQQCWFVKHVPHPPLGVPLHDKLSELLRQQRPSNSFTSKWNLSMLLFPQLLCRVEKNKFRLFSLSQALFLKILIFLLSSLLTTLGFASQKTFFFLFLLFKISVFLFVLIWLVFMCTRKITLYRYFLLHKLQIKSHEETQWLTNWKKCSLRNIFFSSVYCIETVKIHVNSGVRV